MVLRPLHPDGCACEKLSAKYARPVVCAPCQWRSQEAAQASVFASLVPGSVLQVMAYGREIVALVRKVNRVTFVVDGLRPAQPSEIENRDNGNAKGYKYPAEFFDDTLVFDSSIAYRYSARSGDIVI